MTTIDQAVLKAFQGRQYPRLERVTPERLSPETEVTTPVKPSTSTVSATRLSVRELFVDPPETRLQGLHVRASDTGRSTHTKFESNNHLPHDSSRPPTVEFTSLAVGPTGRDHGDGEAQDKAFETNAAAESVLNSLLSYELAIQGPRPAPWQVVTEPTRGTPEPEISVGAPLASVEPTPLADDPTPIAPPAVFKPVWETDAFRLSEVLQGIQSELSSAVSQAVARFSNVCAAGHVVVNVTGSQNGAGLTTVSVLLARALADAGRRVLLVDGDLSGGDMAEQLGVAVDGGWNAHFEGLEDLAESCVCSLEDGLCFLPMSAHGQTSIRAAATTLPTLIASLAPSFDVVIVDAGAGDHNAYDWPMSLLGAHVLVKDARRPATRQCKDLEEELLQSGTATLYVVENFAPIDRSSRHDT